MKKHIAVAVITTLIVAVFSGITAYAEDGLTMTTPGSQRNMLINNVNKTVNKLLSNRALLGLSTDQVKRIKDLAAKVKKEIIDIDARMRILKVDINTLSWEAPIDIDESNALLDKMHKLLEKRGKLALKSIRDLHNILTKEQQKKFNELL